jgi:carboxymethylenebutenolidase
MAVSAAVRSEWVEYSSQGARIRGYLALPDAAGVWPTVIMVHENPGLTEHRQEVTRRLAREGYAVLTPNLWSRLGGKAPSGATEEERRRNIAVNSPDEQVFSDIMQGYALLRERPAADTRRIGLMGICMGGSKGFYAACRSPAFRCFVDFYGAISRVEYTPNGEERRSYLPLARDLACPIQYHVGDQDPVCPMDEVELLREELAIHGKPAEFYVYPGAVHAFHDDTLPQRYHPEAAALAWERGLEFYRRYLQA